MITFFDTETTGLPKFKQGIDDLSQPRIVQFAFLTTDLEGNEITHGNFIFQSDIPSEPRALQTHGISEAKCAKYGLRQSVAANLIRNVYEISDLLVAHNIGFDDFICKCHLARFGVPLKAKDKFCTLDAARDILKIPPTEKMKAAGFNKFKNPNLGECYKYFFDKELEGAHDALVDVKACKDVYFELVKRGAA